MSGLVFAGTSKMLETSAMVKCIFIHMCIYICIFCTYVYMYHT